MELDGARVLVTGASSGIGAALAPLLAARGAEVALVARRADRLASVLERCRAHTSASRSFTADLADPSVAAGTAIAVRDAMGGVDCLVNNAAMPKRVAVTRLDDRDLTDVMNLNFHAPVRMTLALLPGWLEAGRGRVVNVASMGGRIGIPGESAYCASKFALCGWSETAAMELHGTGVEVQLLLPGPVDSEIWDVPGNDPPGYDGPLVAADECAAAIVDAIEQGGFQHYVPAVLPGDGRAAEVVALHDADVDGYIELVHSMVGTADEEGAS
jgi:short-subunit dehydrogenase